jgi:dipeptidyl aminopeptidase/acylaminoacyl peptidase
MSETPIWERRFRAPKMTLPRWSRRAPDHAVYEGTESGVWQVHTWDVGNGTRRQVTDHPVGVVEGYATLDGEGVLWFEDETGDESGRWLVQAFDGGEATPFVEGLPRGWPGGIAQAPGIAAAGISDDNGFGIYVTADGAPAKELARSTEIMDLAGSEDLRSDIAALSSDGSLLAIEHAELGDGLHRAVRVVESRTGSIVGEQYDEGRTFTATAWSPAAGDMRLAVAHERQEWQRAALWTPSDGSWVDLPWDGDGDVHVADWYPDASAVLLVRTFEGRQELYRQDIGSGAVERIDTPEGHLIDARVRPDETVWYVHSDGAQDIRVLDEGGRELLRPVGDRAPDGRPYVSWSFENREGQRAHGFYVVPEGDGPWPIVMLVHGGPTWLDEDRFNPEVQAYIDAGLAVAMVNYRGSTGYGRAWRDALIGRIGGPDVDDVTDGFRDLVDRGIADPSRAVVAGWSWGSYVTLMQLGTNPDLWRCGVAGIPVGDYEAGYEDLSPPLKAYDRALLGGRPDEVPELMAFANPINHADEVRAPVLFVIGENDSRCPLRQAMAYVDRLAARGHPHRVHRFGTGHGSNDTDEEVRQMRVILDFLRENVPGLRSI